jgi:hypothetical protein
MVSIGDAFIGGSAKLVGRTPFHASNMKGFSDDDID